jgi:uncharacterized protein YjbI with pentapeptide repeats
MLSQRAAQRIRIASAWLVVLFANDSIARGDIFRWDNGQVIPGTEGITPGPGVQLVGLQLEYAGLVDIDLTGANFSRSNLTNASLFNSTLTSTNLAGANLTNAELDFAILSNANLAGAIVNGAIFAATTLLGFTKEQLYSTASYQQKNLREIRFGYSNCKDCPPPNDLTSWDLSNQDLTDADFGGSTLTGANLAGANLMNAGFESTSLTNVDLAGAIVMGANFNSTTGFTKEQLYSTASYQQKNLRGIGLVLKNFTGWDLSGQDLTNANLFNSILTSTNLAGANLTNVVFGPSTLTNAILTAADLRGATGVNLTGVVVSNAIRQDGKVLGLDLAGGDELVVHDDDGVSNPPPKYWLTPRTPIPITVRDHFVGSEGSVLRLIFDADPWDSLISFAPGIPVQLGGTIELGFAPDVDLQNQLGRTIRLFNWSGVTPAGAFTVSSPYTWDLSKLYTTGEVTLIAVPAIPGDFNSNGIVDTADYVVWRKGLGTTYTQSDYGVWRAHFGQSIIRGAFTTQSVPEPNAIVLFLFLLSAFGRFAHRTVANRYPVSQQLATYQPLASRRRQP